MTTHHHPIKTALALSLALGALVPAAAQARPHIPIGASAPAATSSPARGQAFFPYGVATPAPARTSSPTRSAAPRAVHAAPRGFDWGDAGIGATAGVGVSALAVGASLLLAGKRRRYAPAR